MSQLSFGKRVLCTSASLALASTMVAAPLPAVADQTKSEIEAGTEPITAESVKMVNVIVQMKDDAGSGVLGKIQSLLGKDTDEQQRQELQEEVVDAAQEYLSDAQEAAAEGKLEGKAPQSLESSAEKVAVSYDYRNAFSGFAIKVPAGVLAEIQAMDGVEGAFVERAYHAPKDEGSDPQASGTKSNRDSLAMTGADSVEQTGEGKVVAVIDTGVDTSHEAFTGDIDEGKARWSESSMAQVRSQLQHGGQEAVYVSEKIPFAYDYGDGDTNAKGDDERYETHGSHVAGIVSANAGEMRGTAPDSQLLAMKVSRYGTRGSMYDSDILAALDDSAVLLPDVINMSLGMDGGFTNSASGVYGEVFETLEAKGVTLCIAAGNAYYSTKRSTGAEILPLAQNPDTATVSSPSSFIQSFSVASAENSSGAPFEVNDFSSWGPTPELKMKPEITGPGGSIYSSVHDNEYENMSGTSMSTPHVAGLSLLVKQYVDTDDKFTSLNAEQKDDVVTQLLMSTAVPVERSDIPGSYYSPRQQGAGLANVSAATSTSVYLTVEGAEDVSRSKAELGSNDRGSWSFSIELHNLGDNAQVYKPDTAGLSELIEAGSFQLKSANYINNGIDISYGGDYDQVTGAVSVDGHSAARLNVTISCDDTFKEAVAQAVNGTFVDGFVRLLGQDGAVDLGVPFLAFYGDWGKAPVFDTLAGKGEYSVYSSKLFSDNGGYTTMLGINPLRQSASESAVDFDKMVISNANIAGEYIASDIAAAPSSVAPRSGMLRNADEVTYTYKNFEGKTIQSNSYTFATKAIMFDGTASLYGEGEMGLPSFSALSTDGTALPDGIYTLEQTAKVSGSDAVQSRTYQFYIDNKAPVLSSAAIKVDNEGKVRFQVTDDTFLAAVDFTDSTERGYFHRINGDDLEFIENADGTRTYSVDIDMSDLVSSWSSSHASEAFPSTFSIRVWDYGLNSASNESSDGPAGEDFEISSQGVLTAYKGESTVVTVPAGVSSIGDGAFSNTKVKSVTIPSSVRSIGTRAFYNAAALRSINFETGENGFSQLEEIGIEAFVGTAIKEVTLPDSVSWIGHRAFAGVSLEKANLGQTFTQMADVPEGHESYDSSVRSRNSAFAGSNHIFYGRNPKILKTNSSRNGTYQLAAELNSESQPVSYAEFGEEIKTINFTWNDSGFTYGYAPPEVMVVSGETRRISFPQNMSHVSSTTSLKPYVLRYDPSSVTIYAPYGTSGWSAAETALETIGADPAVQLKDISDRPKDPFANDSVTPDPAPVDPKPVTPNTDRTSPRADTTKTAKKVTSITVNARTVTARTIKKAAAKAGAKSSTLTSITLGPKVRKINNGVFKSFIKVKTLVVKTKRLSKKSVKNSLKSSKVKNVRVSVGSKKANKKLVKKYKKIFTKKNSGKKVKVR